MRALLVIAFALVACTDPGMRVDSVTPDYGPLAGGTQITLEGAHFPTDARVFIGNRESPLAAVSLDGTKLDVVIPPGERAGAAKVIVLAPGDFATLHDAFRYTAEPTIDSLSVARIVPGTSTVVQAIGSGFADDGAGDVIVLVDGIPATNVVVQSDTSVTFTVPDGPLLVQPTVQLLDDRGTATLERAFRYVPTLNPSLVLIPNYTGELAEVFDLTNHKIYSVPRPMPINYRYTSIYVDGRGDYWAIDRARRFGRLDMRTGQIVNPATLSTELPAMTPYVGTVLAIDRFSIGTVDASNGVFFRTFNAPIGCCGAYGIAADDTTLYVTSRANGVPILRTFDIQTGQFSGATNLTATTSFSPEELRVVNHVLYTTSRDGTLCTIDPATGIVTVVASIPRSSAFDVVP